MFDDLQFPNLVFLVFSPQGDSPTVADMLDVQAVGIGLYLGLVVIQSLASGGLSTLRRKLEAAARMAADTRATELIRLTRSARSDLTRLEIRLDAVNGRVGVVTSSLLALGLAGFVWSTLNTNVQLSALLTGAVIVFYIGIPAAIFIVGAANIRRKCRETQEKITNLEKRCINWTGPNHSSGIK